MEVEETRNQISEEPPLKKTKICESETTNPVKPTEHKLQSITEHQSSNCSKDGVKNNETVMEDGHDNSTSQQATEIMAQSDAGSIATADESKPETKPDSLECSTTVADPTSVHVGPVSEEEVGITEYISSHDGFSAIIKQRYSDFIVNEINRDGNTVHLALTDLPPIESQSIQTAKEDDTSETKIISDVDIAEIQKLVDSEDKKASYCIKVDSDKEARKKIHLEIKKRFPQVNSNTEKTDGDESCIKITIKSKGDNRRSESTWPPNRGTYCHFVMYKEGIGTMDAVYLMSRYLKIKPSVFHYAGTKDKRGKTSQDISAYKVDAKKLLSVNDRFNNVVLGNFRYEKEDIALGQLSGNHFAIVLRNVTGNDSQIESAMTSMKVHGFINYFGMQRFGTTSIPTHHVGRALLHSNWEEAVELILKPSKSVQGGSTKSFDNSHIEKTLVKALQKYGERNFSAALSQIARNTRLMYVHAYQSYVWNSMVSKRLKLLGYKPVLGDLVVVKDDASKLKSTDFQDSSKDQDVVKVKPIVLNADNIGDFKMADVVLPLPGHQVIYPENSVAEWYKEIMELDNLDINNMKKNNKDYSLPGTYRHLVIQPADVTWKTFHYDDYTVPLVPSDRDILKKLPEPVSVENGKFKALVMELTLPPACYATMAIREVLKTSTSASYQTSINVT